MCRTVHTILASAICLIQMVVRIVMTFFLMIENLVRMLMQMVYNTISFILQLISLLPICVILIATSKMKWLVCNTGGCGGGCSSQRGGTACDCLMTGIAIVILYFIFRATGTLDKIFYKLGYAKAAATRTPGTVTACSRNDTAYYYEYDDDYDKDEINVKPTPALRRQFYLRAGENDEMDDTEEITGDLSDLISQLLPSEQSNVRDVVTSFDNEDVGEKGLTVDILVQGTGEKTEVIYEKLNQDKNEGSDMTTVVYYLVA